MGYRMCQIWMLITMTEAIRSFVTQYNLYTVLYR